MNDLLPPSLFPLEMRTVVINDPDSHACYQVTVPAQSDEDAWRFLALAGSGGVAGTGATNLYLGAAPPLQSSTEERDLSGVHPRPGAG
jgi:hypothetical protein